ncbi:MAG: hypothetical protein N2643_00310 [Endomicrobia bacterium]|nr:hypothetical protein [Endomicrobiia bacterium]
MKKIISILTLAVFIITIGFSQEAKNDLDVDVDVDVVVEAKDSTLPPISTEEIVQIVSNKLNKNQNLTQEQKQKIVEMVKQKIEKSEVPSIQFCIEVCKQSEFKWKKVSDIEVYKKDVEKIEKKIKEDLNEAKIQIENMFRNRKKEHIRAENAVEVLETLVDNGIPVKHALDVVKEAARTEGKEVTEAAKLKFEEKLKEGKIGLPVEILPVEFQQKIQQNIRERLEQKLQNQYQYQHQYQYQYQHQLNHQSGTPMEIQTQLQNQMLQEYINQQILNTQTQTQTSLEGICVDSNDPCKGDMSNTDVPNQIGNSEPPKTGDGSNYDMLKGYYPNTTSVPK